MKIDLDQYPEGGLIIVVPPDLDPHFRKLVVRAMMTWQEPHPEIRKFADQLSGLDKALQTALAGRQDDTEGKIQ